MTIWTNVHLNDILKQTMEERSREKFEVALGTFRAEVNLFWQRIVAFSAILVPFLSFSFPLIFVMYS